MLGHSGIALERDPVGRCGDDGGVGQNDDVEGHSPYCRVEPEGLSKGGGAEQAGHAGALRPLGPPPEVASIGYSDPAGLNIMISGYSF